MKIGQKIKIFKGNILFFIKINQTTKFKVVSSHKLVPKQNLSLYTLIQSAAFRVYLFIYFHLKHNLKEGYK